METGTTHCFQYRHNSQFILTRSLRTTEVYTKVEKQDLKKVVDACHPRKWKHLEHAIA